MTEIKAALHKAIQEDNEKVHKQYQESLTRIRVLSDQLDQKEKRISQLEREVEESNREVKRLKAELQPPTSVSERLQ